MCCYELYLAALGVHQIVLGVHQIAQGGRQAALDVKGHQTALGCHRIALEDHALYKPESQRMQWQSHINQDNACAADSSTVHIITLFALWSNTNRQGYGQSLLLWYLAAQNLVAQTAALAGHTVVQHSRTGPDWNLTSSLDCPAGRSLDCLADRNLADQVLIRPSGSAVRQIQTGLTAQIPVDRIADHSLILACLVVRLVVGSPRVRHPGHLLVAETGKAWRRVPY